MTMDAETTTDDPPPAPSVDALASSLPQPVREYAELAFRPPESGLSGSEEDQASARVDRLEVSLRGRLLAITGQILDDGDGDGGGGGEGVLLAYFRQVARLVLETVRLVPAEEAGGGDGSGGADSTDNAGGGGAGIRSLIASSPSFKRLPFLLLEDAIDSLPFTSVQSAWTGGLSSLLCPRSGLCSPAVFGQQSKFVLLRITNKLLRQCSSRGSDSGFAGGLMRMTASVFPLSERSAVNVLGTFHGSGNPTTVEGRDEFEGRRRKASQDATGDRGGQSPDGVGYEFYETFWGIQAVFADPPSTVLPSRTLGQKAALERYNAFMEGAGEVLSALESTPVSSQSSSSATARPADGGAPAAAAVRHHKYLTNSSLLHLQLRDGTLRSHVLTQLLVVLKYLAGNHASLPTGPINATPGGDAARLTQQINKGQVKQLAALDRRARDLLRATSGPDAVNLVSWLLKEREAGWKVWKKNRCMPALDRAGPPDVSGRDVRALLLSGRKRKARAAAADGAADNNGGGSIDVRRDLPGIAAGINAEVPKVDSFLEPYREALDPENEIDDEYHPRNDGVYSWRALRLLSRDASSAGPAGEVSAGRISRLRTSDGDFEAVVRDARGGDGEIGGGLPADYFQRDVVARTALEEVPPAAARAAAAAKADGDGAADDDSVSVGSLFEEDEDTEVERKEQMREFERAAMEVEREILGGSSHSIKAEEPEEDEKKEKNKTDEAGASSPAAKNENKKEEKGSAASKESGGPERKRMKTEMDDGGNAAAVKAEPRVKAEDRRAADHPKPAAAPTRGGHGHQHGRGGDSRHTTRQQENPRGGRAKFTPPDRKGQGRDGDHPQQPQQQQQRDESRGRRGGPGGGGGGKGRFADRNDPPHQQNQQQQRPRGAGDDRRGGGGHGVNPRDGGRGGDSRPPHDAEVGRRGGERRDHNQDGGRRGNDGGGKGDVNGGRADKGRRDSEGGRRNAGDNNNSHRGDNRGEGGNGRSDTRNNSNSNNNKNRGDGGGDQQPHRGRGRQQHPQNNNRPTIENGGGRGDINQQQKQQQPRPRFEPPGGQGRGWGGGARRHNNSQQRGRGGRN